MESETFKIFMACGVLVYDEVMMEQIPVHEALKQNCTIVGVRRKRKIKQHVAKTEAALRAVRRDIVYECTEPGNVHSALRDKPLVTLPVGSLMCVVTQADFKRIVAAAGDAAGIVIEYVRQTMPLASLAAVELRLGASVSGANATPGTEAALFRVVKGK